MKQNNKIWFQLITALIMLLVTVLLCTHIGSQKLDFDKLFTKETPDHEIFFSIRLPRVLLAGLVGAALAASGCVFQALLRNPLADPYILGISSGAGLGAMIAMILGIAETVVGMSGIAVFAFLGALATVWLVWWIGGFTGRTNGPGLLLAGVVVNAFLSSSIMFLSTIAKADRFQSTLLWLMGYLQAPRYGEILIIAAVVIAIGVGIILSIAPQLNILSLGSMQAKTLGVHPEKIFLTGFAAASLITAIAVSFSGLIGFAGLIIPHFVRLLIGPDHRKLIPFSVITGAIFLIISDTFARTIVAPTQLPVGIITAMTGGPFFLILLIQSSKKTRGL